uniref:Uncharacterized protein n=1 Tax=Steinernema glaseri TaxID=37863 RepID=A0A1I7YN70_9BILA
MAADRPTFQRLKGLPLNKVVKCLFELDSSPTDLLPYPSVFMTRRLVPRLSARNILYSRLRLALVQLSTAAAREPVHPALLWRNLKISRVPAGQPDLPFPPPTSSLESVVLKTHWIIVIAAAATGETAPERLSQVSRRSSSSSDRVAALFAFTSNRRRQARVWEEDSRGASRSFALAAANPLRARVGHKEAAPAAMSRRRARIGEHAHYNNLWRASGRRIGVVVAAAASKRPYGKFIVRHLALYSAVIMCRAPPAALQPRLFHWTRAL